MRFARGVKAKTHNWRQQTEDKKMANFFWSRLIRPKLVHCALSLNSTIYIVKQISWMSVAKLNNVI